MEQLELSKADDIINSIYDMEYVDLDAEEPELEVSVEPLRAERDAENERFKEAYKRAMKKWDSRVEALSNNKHKLRSKVLEFCTDTMEQKLKQVPNWDNELRRDPIRILKKIKKFMTTSDETDWDFFVLWEALSKFINCRQNNNETPNEFRKRIEDKGKTVRALLGEDFLDHFASNTSGYEALPVAAMDGQETDRHQQIDH